MSSEVQTTQGGGSIEPRAKQALEHEGTRPGWIFRPDVDIVERPAEYVVTADLPGAGEGDVQVHLENGVLSIDAQPSVAAEESWNPLYAEYRLGAYHREFSLTDAIDASKISATMREGVLEIHLPKAEQHQPRRIEIQRG